jgi:hypothetical protein
MFGPIRIMHGTDVSVHANKMTTDLVPGVGRASNIDDAELPPDWTATVPLAALKLEPFREWLK